MNICISCGTQNLDEAKFCLECGYSFIGATGQLVANTVMEGRYIIIRTLGRGGMGAVYLALDQRLNNIPVAIKEMNANAVGKGSLQAAIGAFKQEAIMLISLRHPALPRITDFFSKEEDRWYLVMDYIEGENLKTIAEKRGPIPEAEVLDWAKQLCGILEYLHIQKPPVIFRDLKPANIMKTPQGQIKLIDFGIARHFRRGQTSDTTAYGSQGFAPPEQFGQDQTDVRSDIYALGATLHYLLTGVDADKNPFIFEPPGKYVKISPEFEAIIMKSLEFKAQDRLGSADEMLTMLQTLDLKDTTNFTTPLATSMVDRTFETTPLRQEAISPALNQYIVHQEWSNEQPEAYPNQNDTTDNFYANLDLNQINQEIFEEPQNQSSLEQKKDIKKKGLYLLAGILAAILLAFGLNALNTEKKTLNPPNIISPSKGDAINKEDTPVKWAQVSGATGYKYALKDLTEKKLVIPESDTNRTEFVIASSKLTPGHEYEITVSAKDVEGNELGTMTNLKVATPLNAPQITSPLNGANLGKGDFKAQWNIVTGAVEYNYSVRDLTSDAVIVPTTKTLENSFTLTSALLNPGHKYKVWVAAVDDKGNVFDTANAFTVKNSTLKAPEIISPKKNVMGKSNLNIEWIGQPGTIYYTIEVTDLTSRSAIVPLKKTSEQRVLISASKLKLQHRYSIRVVSIDAAGNQSPTEKQITIEEDAKGKEIATIITGPVITPKNGSAYDQKDIRVTWSRVNGAAKYEYSMKNLADGAMIIPARVTREFGFVIKAAQLRPGNRYTIKVTSLDIKGKAFPSYSTISIKPQNSLPTSFAPVLISPRSEETIYPQSIIVAWKKVDRASSYAYSVRDLSTNYQLIPGTKTFETSFAIKTTSLTQGHLYRIYVEARDAQGNKKGTYQNLRIKR